VLNTLVFSFAVGCNPKFPITDCMQPKILRTWLILKVPGWGSKAQILQPKLAVPFNAKKMKYLL
jgi:hypothetical protein